MSKFKVGDKVMFKKEISDMDWAKKCYGKILTIKAVSGWTYTVNEVGYGFAERWLAPVVADRHELHITSDGTTTNAVYKLNGKVTKTAKAVCCPSDTFDFNTGAELAINRVLYGTDYNPKDVVIAKPVCAESAPKRDEPKFKIGQKYIFNWPTEDFDKTVIEITSHNKCWNVFKVIKGTTPHNEFGTVANDFSDSSRFAEHLEPYAEPSLTVTRDMLVKLNACSAGLAEFDAKFPRGSGEFEAVKLATNPSNSHWLTERKSQIEAMQNQPKQEAVTLYCVKDYKDLSCSTIFTHGKLYEVDENGQIKTDTGFTTYRKWGSDEMKREFPVMSACLIRTEKRPAKLGEWVLIVNENYITFGDYHVGDVLKAVEVKEDGHIWDYGTINGVSIYPAEYLVLPDYQPEKVEPTYYSGIVLCKSSQAEWWTVGKKYAVIDGKIIADDGDDYDRFKSVEELNAQLLAKFIECRGEQSC